MNTETKQKPQLDLDKVINDQLMDQVGEAILLALELERLFKVYSYRIIKPEAFLESVKSAVEDYQNDN